MLYFSIVLITMLICYSVTLTLTLFDFFTLKEALLGPILTNFYAILILAIVSGCFRFFINVKKINFNLKIFNVSQKEFLFYKKIKVKNWKDKIPELGNLGNFPKRNLLSYDTEYLKVFLQETCFAEIMHLASGIIAFSILFFVSTKSLVYVLPIIIVNFILHILPCFVQRYVRFKMIKFYKHKLKKDL